MAPTDPPRKRSRLWRFCKRLLGLTAALAALAAALPWLASTPPARRWLVARTNGLLAPTRIELKGLQLSWLGAQELRGLVLRDRHGKSIVSVGRLSVRRSLIGLVRESPLRCVVLLDGATLDLERRRDGALDLLEALEPLLGRHSRIDHAPPAAADPNQAPQPLGVDLTLKLVRGSLRVRAPELPEPLVARRVALTVHLPENAGPLTWQLALADPADGDDATLELGGQLDHLAADPARADLTARVRGKHWPWSVDSGGVIARGRLDAQLEAVRRAERWRLVGTAAVYSLDAAGPVLAGDRLRLDRVGGAVEIAETEHAWDVRRLDVTSPVGSVRAAARVGDRNASLSSRIEGELDLAALARQLPHAMRVREGLSLEKGLVRVVVDLQERQGAGAAEARLGVDARISDLVARDAARTVNIRQPATLSAQVVRRGRNVHVEQLAVRTAFLDASGRGDLEKGVSVTASLDLEGIKTQFQDLVDLGGLDLAGRARLAGDLRRLEGGRYAARAAAEFQNPRVSGLSAEAIARKALRVDVAASGPLGASGLPLDWTQARAAVQTDDLSAESKLSSDAKGRAVRIDELRLVMLPPQGSTAGREPVRFDARGRYVPENGLLELRPLPGVSRHEPVAVGEAGLNVLGLTRGGPIRIAGTIEGDLARLDRVLAAWSGGAPLDLAGAFTLKGALALESAGALNLGCTIESADVSLSGSPGQTRQPLGPLVLGLRAERKANADRIALPKVVLNCRYASLDASATLDEPAGRRLADVMGKVTPHWTALDPLVAQAIESSARLRCAPRPFRVRGPIASGGAIAILQGLDAELGADGFEAVAFGMKLDPTPVAIHWRGRRALVEPIDTTLNGGKTHLVPTMAIDPEGTLTLTLAPGSAIEGAEINDAVSKSLLSYVAPVLHDATRVGGKVSARVARAEIPLAGEHAGPMNVVGQVEFDNVVCTAGPMVSDILSVAGSGRVPSVRLQETIELAIANGRVNQRGLAVPLGRDARLEIDGSVGFDRTLALTARVPVTRGLAPKGAGLDELLEGLRVGVPIRGTLSHPSIDRRAFRVGLREAGKSDLKKTATDFLKSLTEPPASGPER